MTTTSTPDLGAPVTLEEVFELDEKVDKAIQAVMKKRSGRGPFVLALSARETRIITQALTAERERLQAGGG